MNIKMKIIATVVFSMYLMISGLSYFQTNIYLSSRDKKEIYTTKAFSNIETEIQPDIENEPIIENLYVKENPVEKIFLTTQGITTKTWTEEELEMLACVIYGEAGADIISDETRLMVGCVVMNRVEHELYPDTIYEVLTQENQYGQFYWTGIVWPKRAMDAEEVHAVQRAYEIAKRILNGEKILDGDYIFQSEFKQSDDYIYQDGLYFCRYEALG